MNKDQHGIAQPPKGTQAPRPLIDIDDPTKWIALAITVLGIQAWIAGASYLDGYWAVPALPGPFNPKSPQETALYGFMGAFTNWGILGLMIVAFGPICILAGL